MLASFSMAITALAATPHPAPAQPVPLRAAGSQMKPVRQAVPPVPTPDGAQADVKLEPSPALAEPGEARTGPREPEVTTPAGPALADRIEAEARRSARTPGTEAAGDGPPSARDLLPGTAAAAPLALKAPVAGLFGRLAKQVPGLTYRLCVESEQVPVSCSGPQPLAKPVAADVTGDGAPDVAAYLLPSAKPQESEVGLGFTVKRLPGKPAARARVWAEYDGRVSVGFDGLMSGTDRGTFTVGLSGGNVKASVTRTDPGASATTVAGLTGRAMVSLSQTPATDRLTVDASLASPRLDVTASAPARLEALAITGSRVTRAVLDRMPKRARVTLKDGEATFSAPAGIGRAELHDHHYSEGRLARVASVELRDLPPVLTAGYAAEGGKQVLTFGSRRGRAGSARVLYYDRAAGRSVLRAELTGLPASLRLTNDPAAHRVRQSASSPVGRFEAVLQRGGGALATPRGGHVTMIKNGAAYGVSALLTKLSSFDVTYGPRPRARLEAGGGRSFTGAASVDGVHRARLELSNTPEKVDVALDPTGKAVYRSAGTIGEVRAAYANTRSGPAVDVTARGVRGDVRASWELGERSRAAVAGSAPLREIRLHARSGGADLSATVTGPGKRAELVADTAARALTWTAGAPVRSVDALARATVGGRKVRAAARVTGVPARFDASWDPRGYRFRGLSGPVGSAALAFTNHDGAKVPAGPHLAAHYDEASGDLDGAVRVEGLRAVSFTPSDGGFAADVRAAPQTLALSADVTLGDVRAGLLGTAGPAPGRLAVSVSGGQVTYTGTRMDVRARAWAGKAGALRDLKAAPALRDGISLVDGGCRPGGRECAPGAFCAANGCFGVRAHLDVRGLPEKVTVDLARKTFTFDGYRPGGRGLGLYLASTVLAPAPVKAAARLTGLPSRITRMSVGPFGVTAADQGSVVEAAYRIEPAATLGTLAVHAEVGGVRGRVAVAPVPAAVAVHGTYGARTRIRVINSAPVKRLSAQVTVPGAGNGELRFADVPARFGVDADASATGLRVPAVTYKAEGGLSTLDGHLRVDGGLADRSGRLGDVSLSVTDLAADTTVRLGPDLSLDLVSRPVPTGRVALRAGLTVDPVARQRVRAAQDVPYTGGFLSYQVNGDFALGRSSVADLSLAVRKVSRLRVRPGRVPFGLKAPPALGYLTPGFEGDYDRLTLRARGVDLRPDVTLGVRLSRHIGEDVFRESVRLGAATSLAPRRYDQRLRRISTRPEIAAAGVRLACLTVSAKPGFAARGKGDAITLRGADGQQMVSFLDPGGQTPDYAVDLLTHFMSPFPGAAWKVAALAGGCRA
ncbi:hypothetical protein [Nonomuraea sp. SBT364]|uniref:hypothetical protein n=1 Tax=Nonomuraea sp. SBT364 TaxID=1580530 RepID=UPI0012E2611E|nr:hypothetical protein [Nonomuraea sp. SBT364]